MPDRRAALCCAATSCRALDPTRRAPPTCAPRPDAHRPGRPRAIAAAPDPPRPHRIAALTAPEVAARLARGDALLWPLGSTETHGPAAPMGDHLLAEALADRIADTAGDALVAPVLPFGGHDFFGAIPGALALSTPTLTAVLSEGLAAFARHGVRRVVLLNGHGGSVPALEAATRAHREATGRVVPTLHLWRAAAAAHAACGGDPAALGHGGDPVLSVALHLRPDLCRADRVAPRGAGAGSLLGLPVSGFGTLALPGGVEVSAPTEIAEIAPGAGVAALDPRGASAEVGARLTAHLVAAGVALLAAMREAERP